jgi:putative OPT family oligopeptide transporter
MESNAPKGLPANAYTELAAGEQYVPVVPADVVVPEITARSVILGLFMAALFSAAAAYLGLKIGQVFEAAIPIAILAVGFGALARRKSSISENVIVQSIGAASGVVVAGAIFTLPALFILGLDRMAEFYKIFLVSFFGGALGVVFLIPLRRYFCAEQHGKLPFPEATATTEILVAGEKGGAQALVLAYSMAIGGAYDFLVQSVGLWKETFTTALLPGFNLVAQKAKLVFSLNIGAAVMGMGYIIGIRYASIIVAGSLLSWWVFVPLFGWLADYLLLPVPPEVGGNLAAGMPAELLFKTYVRNIGIGGIFAAGLIGIIKSLKIIVSSFGVGLQEIFSSGRKAVAAPARTDRDMKMSVVMGIILLIAIALWVFFYFGVVPTQERPLVLSLIAVAVVLAISFLFTPVAARAIALVGTNPVSGMTLMTLMISSLLLVAAGLRGDTGMLAALLIGGVVCTALSTAGGFITDLKIGYWLGNTPANQERYKFLGMLVAALSVGGVIIMLNAAYGFTPDRPEPLNAPQANAMAAVLLPFMSDSPVPWALYGVGAAVSIIMEMLGIAPLAFALGMYLPLDLNVPILLGAVVAWFVKRGAASKEIADRRNERGTLIASGFIAGGAIMGVVGALLKWQKIDVGTGIEANDWANYISLIAVILLCIYVYVDARRADKLQ